MAENDKRASILDKILTSNNHEDDKLNSKEMIPNIEEEKNKSKDVETLPPMVKVEQPGPPALELSLKNAPIEKLYIITDTEVNIKDEDLLECPLNALDSNNKNALFKSFKPGVMSDNRIIPTTPGENQVRMCERNKPLRIKNKLLQMVNN